MPRRRNTPAVQILNPARSRVANRLRSLTAAGARIKHKDADTIRRLISPWQGRAYAYYDLLGEIKYAAQFYSRALSQLELYAAETDDNGELVRTDNPEVKDMLDRVQDPGGGRAALLAAYGRLMFLAGESYLLCTQDPENEREQWEMLSTDELRVTGANTIVRYKAPSLIAEDIKEPSDDDWEPMGDGEGVVYRIWKRHPRYSMLPDSTMQGVLDLCEELVLLTQAVRARARSRLAGPGVLFMADSFSPPPVDMNAPDDDPAEDPFLAAFTEAAMTPIMDEGSASAVVPLIIRGPLEAIEKGIKHVQIIDPTQLYPENGLRYECIKRLAIGLDMPPEVLMGLQDSNHWCVDDKTEILTGEGWKLHEALAEGDEVLTLNHESGLSEWQPVDHVARFEVEDLPMRSVESRFHSSLTTMNHRWPVLRLTGREGDWQRAWTHSDELRSTHRLVSAAPSRDSLMPQWVQHDDALVELVAWLWTEGQIRVRPGRRSPQVAIYQSTKANPENVLRIRAALTSLYGAAVTVPMRGGRGSAIDRTERWREVNRSGKATFVLNAAAAERLLLHVNPDRVVSTSFIRTLTAAQLALFIDVSTRADGSLMRSGCQLVGQSDPARLAPLELAAILLGRSPSSYTQTHDGFRRHEQHYVSVSERQTVRIKKRHLSEKRYTGTVWCPVTLNSTWLARRNGKVYFTGNTAWQIDEQTWKGHLQPIAQQLVDDLTAAFFRPSLKAAGVAEWDKYSIAFDATAIINHPDRTKDAKDLYDRVAIGKEALRDAAGFDEDDAPSEEERAERIGILTHDSSLAWFGSPKITTGGVETGPAELLTPGGEVTGGQPASGGSEVETGPASGSENQPTAPPAETVIGGARIEGALDLAILRAREAAGSKLRSRALRGAHSNPEIAALLSETTPSRCAFVLGPDRLHAVSPAGELELVEGARTLITDSLRMFGITDEDKAKEVCDRVLVVAARTLYEESGARTPASLVNYVVGLNGNGNGNGRR